MSVPQETRKPAEGLQNLPRPPSIFDTDKVYANAHCKERVALNATAALNKLNISYSKFETEIEPEFYAKYRMHRPLEEASYPNTAFIGLDPSKDIEVQSRFAYITYVDPAEGRQNRAWIDRSITNQLIEPYFKFSCHINGNLEKIHNEYQVVKNTKKAWEELAYNLFRFVLYAS